tara:strand:+ start:60 stop:992 length:933 start_codon:yes stop_codon:yes gene_type:complete
MEKIYYNNALLDRSSVLRKDKQFLTNILQSKDVNFIPMWEEENYFILDNEEIKPLILKKNELELNTNRISLDEMIFLGKINKKFYFSVNLKSKVKKDTLGIIQGDIITDQLRNVIGSLTELDSSYLALAKGMTFWHEKNKFCGVCGSKTKIEEAGFVLKCVNKNCNQSHFPRTDAAIITLVSNKDKVLLARSSRFPQKMYSTLAGFVEPGESLELALKREVFEEVGVNVNKIEYFQSQPWPFPASLMLGFFAETEDTKLNVDKDEIEDANWFDISQLKDLTHPDITDGFKLPRFDSIARRLVNDWIRRHE